MSEANPTVELKLPIIENMELVATQTSEVVSKHMDLSEEQTSEISMALLKPVCFRTPETKSEIYIHFIISDDRLTIKVIDKGKGLIPQMSKSPILKRNLNLMREREDGEFY